MATNRRSSHNTARTLTKAAASATPEAILDIVQRLGLIDLVVDRIRLRLEPDGRRCRLIPPVAGRPAGVPGVVDGEAAAADSAHAHARGG